MALGSNRLRFVFVLLQQYTDDASLNICPFTKLDGSLSRLRSADYDVIGAGKPQTMLYMKEGKYNSVNCRI